MHAEDSSDHNSQCSFGADEQLMQRGSGRRPGTWPGRRKSAVGENGGKSEHHVFDASVAARFLARGSRGDQPTDRCARQRARVVAKRQAARVELLLQDVAVDPRLAPAGEVRLVDLEHAIERAHVEDELSGGRRKGPAHAASTPHRRDRHLP